MMARLHGTIDSLEARYRVLRHRECVMASVSCAIHCPQPHTVHPVRPERFTERMALQYTIRNGDKKDLQDCNCSGESLRGVACHL